MKRNIKKLIGVVFGVFFVIFCVNIEFLAIVHMPNSVHLTEGDLIDINNDRVFGNFISAEINDNTFVVGKEKRHNSYLYLKLFGFLPIKRIDVVLEEKKEVYLGGIPLGFSLNSKGVIVVGENNISSNSAKCVFNTGDIILKIGNTYIEEPQDILECLNEIKDEPTSIIVLRGGQEKEIVAIPQYDNNSDNYKLGLWVRDDAQGIGTLTFVTKDGKFGALGHSINDYETGVEIPVKDGGVYLCNLVGITKAKRGSAGELRCLFSQSKTPYGAVESNTQSGVYGKVYNTDELVDANLVAEIGSRMLVKLGKAKIVSAVGGLREEYDIEIIKTKYQASYGEKSFVFRVTDKRLISLTGGIVQGMSGSPIVQNGKVIGAVTHVFLNDATKGYGIYIDWMMDEVER